MSCVKCRSRGVEPLWRSRGLPQTGSRPQNRKRTSKTSDFERGMHKLNLPRPDPVHKTCAPPDTNYAIDAIAKFFRAHGVLEK